MNETNGRMTLDEILALVTDVAKDEAAGADRFRALRMLAGMQEQGSVSIPPPLTDREVVDRLVRLMKPVGVDLVRVAFAESFGVRVIPDAARPTYDVTLLTPEQRARIASIQSLPSFYSMFPSLKPRGGFPRGYPVRSPLLVRARWLRQKATDYLCSKLTLDGTDGANFSTTAPDEVAVS